MGRHGELSLEYRRWVWEAYLRLERGPNGIVCKGEIKCLLDDTGLKLSQLYNILEEGKAGRLENS